MIRFGDREVYPTPVDDAELAELSDYLRRRRGAHPRLARHRRRRRARCGAATSPTATSASTPTTRPDAAAAPPHIWARSVPRAATGRDAVSVSDGRRRPVRTSVPPGVVGPPRVGMRRPRRTRGYADDHHGLITRAPRRSRDDGVSRASWSRADRPTGGSTWCTRGRPPAAGRADAGAGHRRRRAGRPGAVALAPTRPPACWGSPADDDPSSSIVGRAVTRGPSSTASRPPPATCTTSPVRAPTSRPRTCCGCCATSGPSIAAASAAVGHWSTRPGWRHRSRSGSAVDRHVAPRPPRRSRFRDALGGVADRGRTQAGRQRAGAGDARAVRALRRRRRSSSTPGSPATMVDFLDRRHADRAGVRRLGVPRPAATGPHGAPSSDRRRSPVTSAAILGERRSHVSAASTCRRARHRDQAMVVAPTSGRAGPTSASPRRSPSRPDGDTRTGRGTVPDLGLLRAQNGRLTTIAPRCQRGATGSLRGHADAAVDADRLGVEVAVGHALDDDRRQLLRVAEALREQHALLQVGLERLAVVAGAVDRGVDQARGRRC